MAKQNQYTERWFLDHGYTYDEKTGSWNPPVIKKGFIGQQNGFKQKIIKTERFGLELKHTYINESTQISLPKDSILTIDGLIAGLNGSKGLMQAHWAKNKKDKEMYQNIIAQHLRDNKMRKHLGEVTIQYIGYKSRFMDWDNFCASFKLVG